MGDANKAPVTSLMRHAVTELREATRPPNLVNIPCPFTFLQLARDFPERPLAPSRDADTFWHCHVLTLGLYLEHCQKVFGRPLLHWPFSGALGEADAARQLARFEESRCLISELVARVRSTHSLKPTEGVTQ